MKKLIFREPSDIMELSDALRCDLKRSIASLTDRQARYVLDRITQVTR